MAAGAITLDRLIQARFQAEQHSDAVQQLSAIRAHLEGELNSRLYLAEGLVNYVALHPELGADEFAQLARGVMERKTAIRSVQLARDTVVSHLYPLRGNEAAKGLRLLELAEQAPAVRRALENRATVVAGPVTLVQGGVAFIGRTPIYQAGPDGTPGAGPYWGLATIVIDAPALLREAELTQPERDGWRIAVRGADGLGGAGAVFFGEAAVYEQQPERMEVSLPGGSWELGLLPAEGWGTDWPGRPWFWLGSAITVLLFVLGAWVWVRYPARLRKEVRQATAALEETRRELEHTVEARTAELRATNRALRESEARLAEAQEIAGLGNWERDTSSGHVFWSDEIFVIFGLEPGSISPSYEAFLHCVHPDDRERVRETVAAALDHGTEYALDHRILRPDGSVRVVHEQARIDRDTDGSALRLVGTVLDITERKAAEHQLEFLAYHDPLTRLPNRVLLRDRLEHAIARARRSGEGVALLFIDLDRFKNVNDSLGHHAGDRLLVEVARRLACHMREDDTLARLGGDEFTVVLEAVADGEQVRAAVQKLLHAFADTFMVDERELFVTASIGVSLYPDDGADVDALMSNADAAMYQAKAHGRNDFRFFSEQMSALAHERLALEAGLRRAEERGELELYYQPVVDATDCRTVSLEALLRWRHPEHGIMGPERFIHSAEDSGLILSIGRWVLAQVCEQLMEWRAAGLAPARVFANLSARQLLRGDLADELQDLLESRGVPPEAIGLEITETMLLEPTAQLDALLSKFRSLGIQVAVDDFGVGQSALVYLKRFAVDSLKIDRTFVRDVTTDPNDAAIIEAIVAMAHKLNLTVVAEGVETLEQEQAVRDFGCDQLQGYLYGKPASAADTTALLAATSAGAAPRRFSS